MVGGATADGYDDLIKAVLLKLKVWVTKLHYIYQNALHPPQSCDLMSRVLRPQGFQQSLQPRPLLVNLLTITTFAPHTDTRASHLRPTPTPHTKDLTPTPTPHTSHPRLTPYYTFPTPASQGCPRSPSNAVKPQLAPPNIPLLATNVGFLWESPHQHPH